MSHTILEMWQTFEREVMPADAPPIQRAEMRKAFYAGSLAAFRNFLEISEGDEDVAVAELDALEREGRQYVADLLSGRA